MLRPVRPVGVTGQTDSPVQNGEIRRTLAREGPRQGKCALGPSRIGRPPRMPSDVAEMKEEQQKKGWKELGFRDKSKGNKHKEK